MKITFPVGTTHTGTDCKLIPGMGAQGLYLYYYRIEHLYYYRIDCTCTIIGEHFCYSIVVGVCAWETILFGTPQKYFQYVLSPSFKNRHLAELKIVCKNGWMPKIGMAPAEK